MSSRFERALAAVVQLPRNPGLFTSKLVNRARRARLERTDDPATARFMTHNRRVWRGWGHTGGAPMILTDLYPVAETNTARSYFLNVLARKHGARIVSFDKSNGAPALHRLYRSFNTADHITPKLNRAQETRRQSLLATIRPELRSPRDVFELTVDGIWIGVEIYEGYLRGYSKPTVYLDDPAFWQVLDEALALLIFWMDLLSNPVAGVVVSHDIYLSPGILCKVAYDRNVPVYLPNPVYMTCARGPRAVHAHFPRYREMFRRLPIDEQQAGLALARTQLERRLSGEIGVDMPYAVKSAFGLSSDRRVIRESGRPKVLICTHCFYDNPHAYGGLLFVDFLEWLRFLGKMSEKTDYDWYLKTHPDPLPGTLNVIRDFVRDFPNVTVVPPETPHHQLAAEGIDFALTAYGSIGHEYPALGVQVINAGYNPHVAYGFNRHPRSVAEYEECLLNLLNLRSVKKTIDLDELAEFYYMHHYYQRDDDLVFNSYRQLEAELTTEERAGSAAYEFFLNQLTAEKHQQIIESMQAFIDSGKTHHFQKGPE